MNQWGRKNTVLLSMAVTIAGMFLPLVIYSSATCIVAYILLGIGNAILQISLNPLLGNVITDQRMLTSSLTAGQVIKAISSLVGPEIVLFATLHFGNEHWYYCFPMLGGITLFFGLWLAATPIQRETSSGESVSLGKSFALLKNKTLLVLFLGIFFMVGVDVATNYISSKLMTLRYEWTPDEVKDDRCIFGSFSLNKNFGFTLFSDEHSGMCFSFVITHVYRWTRNIEFDLYWRCRTFFSICFLHNLFIVFSRVSY